MYLLIIFITIVLIITLYCADNSIFNSIIKQFKSPKHKLYTEQEIKEDGYRAIEEILHEIPFGCVFIIFLFII